MPTDCWVYREGDREDDAVRVTVRDGAAVADLIVDACAVLPVGACLPGELRLLLRDAEDDAAGLTQLPNRKAVAACVGGVGDALFILQPKPGAEARFGGAPPPPTADGGAPPSLSHDGDAASEAGSYRSAASAASAVGDGRRSEELTAMRKRADAEALDYALGGGLGRADDMYRRLSDDQRKALRQMEAEGFGIFAPGNPALLRQRQGVGKAAPGPSTAPPSLRPDPQHSVPMPRGVRDQIIGAAGGGGAARSRRMSMFMRALVALGVVAMGLMILRFVVAGLMADPPR